MPSSVPQISQRLSLTAVFLVSILAPAGMAAQSYRLDSDKGLRPHDVTVDRVSYRGRNAVRVRSLASADAVYDAQKSGTGGGIVLLEGSSFHDGTIAVDVAGNPHRATPVCCSESKPRARR